ncbi:transaldolase family protein [Planctomicrobium piriforme]|uniref:Transaldolase n=1 Tax=Planctomicrobium piriforme TaxID=1576369 RepID=A0A1I3BM05_9PLAN|nr:transaldolase family protein [Planctomicrobium piriforme]SFH63302.1 transaldolase [Planctomicrobium piriforme]
MTPLESLVASGTKLWLDSIDPDLVKENRAFGATGATSNPIIISDLIKTGRFDDMIGELVQKGLSDEAIAWELTDQLVKRAQQVFLPVWQETKGNNGYVSFELDPLIEDVDSKETTAQRAARYIELGKKWAAGHQNRMIKVPATPGGLAALEELAAAGVTLNVTLIFGEDQYHTARAAVWKGAQRRKDPKTLKSVYSIFVSRIDVYTGKHVPDLSKDAQGQVGILNVKRLWQQNVEFWKDKGLPLQQEIIFASTGTKLPEDPKDKYVAALAGSDIQTNPPETNDAVQKLGHSYTRMVDKFPPQAVMAEIDQKVDFPKMVETLMQEGLEKFAKPQKALLDLISKKRMLLQPQ